MKLLYLKYNILLHYILIVVKVFKNNIEIRITF